MNNVKVEMDLRSTSHYMVFRIGADTDIHNGNINLVLETLKKLEAKEDYVACQALYDALESHRY